MQITETENGDIVISEFRKDAAHDLDEKKSILCAAKLIEQMDCHSDGYFTSNAYILDFLLAAAREEEKGNGMEELRLLRGVFFCARNRTSHILGKYKEKRKALAKPDTPELIPCPLCGGEAVLKYRGYMPDYFCSKCGNEGGISETKEGAAYNWNSLRARRTFESAVSALQRAEFPPEELERISFLLAEEVMKKEGVIDSERD